MLQGRKQNFTGKLDSLGGVIKQGDHILKTQLFAFQHSIDHSGSRRRSDDPGQLPFDMLDQTYTGLIIRVQLLLLAAAKLLQALQRPLLANKALQQGT